jgi:hypothetical protein
MSLVVLFHLHAVDLALLHVVGLAKFDRPRHGGATCATTAPRKCTTRPADKGRRPYVAT